MQIIYREWDGSDYYNTSKPVCLVEDFEIGPEVFSCNCVTD